MQQPQQLRWIAKPTPRADRITPKKWAEHQEEICQLYEKMKLDDLMSVMRIRHKFTPSIKPPPVHLTVGKWGVQKYKSTSGPQSMASPRSTATTYTFPNSDVAQTPEMVLAKRHHSSLSLQSSMPSVSTRSKPLVPPKRRRVLSEFMASKDPYANLSTAFDNPSTRQDEFESSAMEVDLPRRSFISATKNFGGLGGPSNTVHNYTEENNTYFVSMDDANNWQTINTISSDYSDTSDYDIQTTPGQPTPRASNEQTRVESSRPIESFSPEEFSSMKFAADLLLSLKFDKQSFSLYVLLFKRLAQLPEPPLGQTISALIACARSATSRSQVDIAQNLLENALVDAMNADNKAACFVLRMLLADTFTRVKNYTAAVTHVKRAWSSALAHEDFFSCLPQEYRSLDFCFSHYSLRTLGSLEYIAREGGFLGSEKQTLPVEKQVQEQILRQIPGPFELEDGILRNDCIRSCLFWCTVVLEDKVADSEPWKTFLESCNLQPWVEGEGLESLKLADLSPRQLHNIRRSLSFGLTVHLWQRYQALRTSWAGKWEMRWAEEAENLMGISAAELLEILCQLMVDASLEREFKTSLKLQAREGADYLLGLPDRELAQSVMDCFSRMAYPGPTSTDSTRSELEPRRRSRRRAINHDALDDEAYRLLSRPFVVSLIEETFSIQLPELDYSDIEAKNEGPSTGIGDTCRIYAANMLPTLASSLRSSDLDLASLRILRDRIAEGLSGANCTIQDVVATLPSAFMRDARSSTSLISVEALSQAFSSSLSLLPRPTSSSATEIITTMSGNVSRRFSENRMSRPAHMYHRLLDE